MKTIDALNDDEIEISLIKEIPLSFAKNNMIMPIKRSGGSLVAAVADDRGYLALREIAR